MAMVPIAEGRDVVTELTGRLKDGEVGGDGIFPPFDLDGDFFVFHFLFLSLFLDDGVEAAPS